MRAVRSLALIALASTLGGCMSSGFHRTWMAVFHPTHSGHIVRSIASASSVNPEVWAADAAVTLSRLYPPAHTRFYVNAAPDLFVDGLRVVGFQVVEGTVGSVPSDGLGLNVSSITVDQGDWVVVRAGGMSLARLFKDGQPQSAWTIQRPREATQTAEQDQ